MEKPLKSFKIEYSSVMGHKAKDEVIATTKREAHQIIKEKTNYRLEWIRIYKGEEIK